MLILVHLRPPSRISMRSATASSPNELALKAGSFPFTISQKAHDGSGSPVQKRPSRLGAGGAEPEPEEAGSRGADEEVSGADERRAWAIAWALRSKKEIKCEVMAGKKDSRVAAGPLASDRTGEIRACEPQQQTTTRGQLVPLCHPHHQQILVLPAP